MRAVGQRSSGRTAARRQLYLAEGAPEHGDRWIFGCSASALVPSSHSRSPPPPRARIFFSWFLGSPSVRSLAFLVCVHVCVCACTCISSAFRFGRPAVFFRLHLSSAARASAESVWDSYLTSNYFTSRLPTRPTSARSFDTYRLLIISPTHTGTCSLPSARQARLCRLPIILLSYGSGRLAKASLLSRPSLSSLATFYYESHFIMVSRSATLVLGLGPLMASAAPTQTWRIMRRASNGSTTTAYAMIALGTGSTCANRPG